MTPLVAFGQEDKKFRTMTLSFAMAAADVGPVDEPGDAELDDADDDGGDDDDDDDEDDDDDDGNTKLFQLSPLQSSSSSSLSTVIPP